MALGLEPISNGSLVKTDVAELKKAQVRNSRKSVCPGKRVLWIQCMVGKHWFANCVRSSVERKETLQQVIGENMLVDVVQILEPKNILEHWEF